MKKWVAFGLLAVAAPTSAAVLDLDASNGFAVTAVVRGQTLRLRVDPGAPGYIVLNPAAVRRLGLKGSLIRSETFVGPIRLKGGSNSIGMTVGAAEIKGRAVWIDRDAVADADGLISPEILPFDSVRFRLHAPRPGETAATVPLRFDLSTGLFYRYGGGDRPVTVKFTLADRYSMATAAAGARLSEMLGGRWSGEAREEPVRFGIVRPVRPFTVARPIVLGGFPLRSYLVRTSDFRGAYQLPQDIRDPDEIIVNGAKKSKQPARLMLSVAQDALAVCSSLLYARAARTLSLSCVP